MVAADVRLSTEIRGAVSRLWDGDASGEIVVSGSAGCIAGETRLFDPSTGQHRPIADLWWDGVAPVVQTLAGPVQADVPFLKGIANLYRVTTESGRTFIGTGNHRVLTQRGWTFVADLQREPLLVSAGDLPASTAGRCQSASLRDAGRSSETPPGSLECCSPYRRRDGERLPRQSDNDRELLPSRGDALGRSHADLREDDLVVSGGHSRPYRRSDRRATNGCSPALIDPTAYAGCHVDEGMPTQLSSSPQSDDQSPRSLVLERPTPGSDRYADSTSMSALRSSVVRPSLSGCVGLEPVSPRVLRQLLQRSDAPGTDRAVGLSGPALDACIPSLDTSKCNYTALWDTVSSVEYVRTDAYFDLHVPGVEHYLAEGIWHHNTGKTRAMFEWLHWRCQHETIRVLVLRKTQVSLKGSALVTFQEQVLYQFDGKQSQLDGVRFYGGNDVTPARFVYATTGSVIIAGGMDNVAKVLSTEFDVIYVNECTELVLAEWERLAARVDRPALVDRPPSLLIGDCNPNVPTHWIKRRAAEGTLQLLVTHHEDNPAMWDADRRQWTPAGRKYLKRLDTLSGVEYKRMRRGLWVAAEGQVFEEWDEGVHLIDRFDIPADWPRYWLIDFGYRPRHPYVHQWWTESPGGQLIRYREIYMTGRLVEDHVEQAMRLSAHEPRPTEVITDHDAEDRATFERKSGYRTRAAIKNVSAGIQAVQARLRVQGDGKAGIAFMRDSVVERDPILIASSHPTCTEEEFPAYVWNTGGGRKTGEEPMKEYDHGMDDTRYMVAFKDLRNAPSGIPATPDDITRAMLGDLADDDFYGDDPYLEYGL